MIDEKLITHQSIEPELLRTAKENRRKMTPMEAKLWERLRSNQLGGFHFRRQQVVGHYIVDFLCNSARLIIEVDGEAHNNHHEYDHERELDLQAYGLRVIRFTNFEIESQVDEVLSRILKACRY
jgi:very-short-patch-repair endonuclease